jgi:hypothetical protein
MIDTRLILIEGVPCSGKSTTAEILAKDLSTQGIRTQCYLEWSDDNPIFIGKMDDLCEIIATTKSREADNFQQWEDFTQRAKQQNAVNIIESRFWQTHGMYLYLSGHSEQEVLESTRMLISIVAVLDPVLIYLAPADVEQLQMQIAEEKNKSWQQSGREGSWEDWGNAVYEQQQWFTRRSLTSEAMRRFFDEWVFIADQLYKAFPFRKIKIQDPQIDWNQTMDHIRDFIEINSS